MLCLCNPHNPYGLLYTKEELDELLRICEKHGLWIMNDEVWSDIVYGEKPFVSLHVVTDWQGSSASGSAFMEESLSVFDLLEEIHRALTCMEGETFLEFDLVESRTNHNHDEIIENIETYQCVAIKSL